MNLWLYIISGLFALLGVWTVVRWIATGWQRFVGTVTDLSNTLKDAAEVAKAYREDVQILKQIAQSAAPPNFREEPESIIPRAEQAGSRMPDPYFGRFPVKPVEQDAPHESVREVDVTATDEDFVENEKNEAALNFEVSERQKAATREADRVRLKELADLSGEPEGQ
jgi:hypothetical protein